jgi:hypothetical protein
MTQLLANLIVCLLVGLLLVMVISEVGLEHSCPATVPCSSVDRSRGEPQVSVAFWPTEKWWRRTSIGQAGWWQWHDRQRRSRWVELTATIIGFQGSGIPRG